MASHPDLQAEQAHIDRAYDRVAALRAAASELLETVLRQRGGTPGSLAERDVIVRTTLLRLEQLDVGRESLCFGRIDRTDGEAFHIGRLAVSGEDQEPLVVDWRAPVAEPFYRATGVNTMGLVRRRHFATEGRRLLGIEDEVFGVLDATGALSPNGTEGSDDDADSPALASATPGTLLTALERARSGRMRDIVATVQKEQDEVIRADLGGVLVVQGGPGTGKTAVALHRAAYLLYTHRFPLERQGVLVVGPNPLFLRYIEQVLPSLGENGVVLSTISGLVPDARVRADDTALAASVKSGPRMVEFVADAVADRQRPLRKDLVVGFEGFLLRVPAVATARMVEAVQRRPGTHNARRRQIESLLSRQLHQQYRQAAGRRVAAGLTVAKDDIELEGGGRDDDEWRDDLGSGELSEAELWSMLRELPVVEEALNRMWPVLTPEELLHDLFGAPALIRLAARGRLSEEEQASLVRRRSDDLDRIPWTAHDLALLDEARVLLGPRRPNARRGSEVRQYGHIVVDEAQDLTPMQLRMLARRSLSGSMTVAGDIAQATGPRALSDWVEVTSYLPDQKPARVVELSVNYRTPAEVMDLAAKVLAVTAPHLRPPVSARSTGEQPVAEQVDRDGLLSRVASLAASEAAAVSPGTVAVVVVPSMEAEVEAALAAAGIRYSSAERDGMDADITVIQVGTVKGLEFDAVVVVEPERVVAESPQGLRALYVAMTRATRRLTLVHAEPLPAVLTS